MAIGKTPETFTLRQHFLRSSSHFAGLKTDTVEKFEASLNDHVEHSRFECFKKRYNLSFERNEQNALATFQRLVEEVKRKNEKVKHS